MYRANEILFRVSAGMDVGLGHLSRCMNIACELSKHYSISFFIETDTPEGVSLFLDGIAESITFKNVFYFPIEEHSLDISRIVDYISENNAFLVLDHYRVDEDYQLSLKVAGVHWMQLDSHAAQVFYADIVQHGSPGATEELYKNLHGTDSGIFLLGPKYVIVNNVYCTLHNTARVRKTLSRILVSFGGGYAKGALKKYIPHLATCFPTIDFHIVFRGNHPDRSYLESIANTQSNIHLYIDYDDIPNLMLNCDLGILASGGMSYEAATLGLPLILIGIEDNQYINLKGCSDLGIACSLGTLSNVTPELLCKTITLLQTDISRITEMSKQALENFDGKGVKRIAKVLEQTIISNIS
ncbi:MAG: UDP-2,4-diacetamido-2,4,6-trideoxy-beta-L-altropyranose hydrolase [Prevotella sp.]|nr:UDP-2,4-diacetamido-2,4,6-trideoxy-beta-L-altropyranose hydrolase [Prevotella sp.]